METDSTTFLKACLLGAGALVGLSATADILRRKRVPLEQTNENDNLKIETPVKTRAAGGHPLLDGIGAVENVSYSLSDETIVVTPSSTPVYRILGDESKGMAAAKTQNRLGRVGAVEEVRSLESVASTALEHISDGKRVSVLVPSSASLIEMIPVMYQLADKRLPCVIHAFPGSVDADLSYNLSFAEAFATRQTGLAIVHSSSVVEAQDMALLCAVASTRFSTPFLHTCDSAYHGRTDVQLLSSKAMDTADALMSADEVKNQPEEGEIQQNDSHLYLRSGAPMSADLPDTLSSLMHELQPAFGGRQYNLFEYEGSLKASSVIVAMGAAADALTCSAPSTCGVLKVRVFRPWSTEHLLAALPETVTKVAVLEHVTDQSDEWGPLFLDVVSTVQGRSNPVEVVSMHYSGNSVTTKTAALAFAKLCDEHLAPLIVLPSSNAREFVASRPRPKQHVFAPEASYTKILKQALGERLLCANVLSSDSIWGSSNGEGELGDIEYGYGVLLSLLRRREDLTAAAAALLADEAVTPAIREGLAAWMASRGDGKKNEKATRALLELLSQADAGDEKLAPLLKDKEMLRKKSPWLIGGSNWAQDLSLSGIHHIVSSSADVNVLVLDTEVYSEAQRLASGANWKKDIGLYAMTYGGVYVASVSEYASYTQVLRAFMEADAFPGPSIILAYAPGVPNAGTQEGALASLKESKLAVDTGKFPLYRWNPANADAPFTLDSSYIKQQLKKFLERDNQLSLLANDVPAVNKVLATSLNEDVSVSHVELQRDAVTSYTALLKGLSNSQPVLFLYGSDGGNAEGVAKRLQKEAIARGLDAKCLVADDCPVPDLKDEPNVVFVVSTAGQGEFPANSKQFWASLCSDTGPGWLAGLTKVSVFAMGDSHYWPRPGEEHYFCKAGRDVWDKMLEIGAEALCDIGIGDDQGDDGYETGLAEWADRLWESLGVGGAGGMAKEPKIDDDKLKIDSNYLRGTILQGLSDESTGALAETDCKLTKFHGIYMQDDRDIRDARRVQGLEKAYSFMIRVGLPGGFCTPAQYLVMDDLGRDYGNGGLKITTRQAWQLHCVTKKTLKHTMQEINRGLMTSLAACGDVNRNVMSCPLPLASVAVWKKVQKFADDVTQHLFPKTSAYHEIWMDKKQVAGYVDEEPIYGQTYLPRKFKMAISVPPYNDCDIFAHCMGFIAIVEEGELVGFNISVGGGMGMTHGNKATYPCVGQIMGFVAYEDTIPVSEAVVTTQRDFGERKNRKHARLKYTVEDMGLDAFRAEVEKRSGVKMQPAKPFEFTSNGDRFGWLETDDGMWHYGMFIENGRVIDRAGFPLKTGLREVAEMHTGDFRLSPNGNIFICNVKPEDRDRINAIMNKHGIGNKAHSALRMSSMACAALPMCALSFAEAERYLPSLISKVDEAIIENGLKEDSITMRMTGCPNGCARPYLAEIGFVGKAPGTYNMYLGAAHDGSRLSKLYKENMTEDLILEHLKPMIKDYAKNRRKGEWFGDFVIRTDIVNATKRGSDFHENLKDVYV